MNESLYKIGLRLSRYKFVRRAIEERADLSEFRKRPTFRIFAGISLICLSMVMSWPVLVAVCGTLALHLRKPWITALIIPLYIFSHGLYISGMVLSGEKYTRIFFRWMMRRITEWLLSWEPVEEGAEL